MILSIRHQPLAVLLGIAMSPSAFFASDEVTREMYSIRQPGVHREAMKILDLGTFLLTNSEDGRPKQMVPFYLNIFETQDTLLEDSLIQVEEATNALLLTELQALYTSTDRVASVRSRIVSQDRVITNVGDRRGLNGHLRRQLASVPGARMRMHVNVTFDREPSPDAAYVDDKLQMVMRDLSHLVNNITATDDTELDGVFLAYREEINAYYESPAAPAADSIQKEPTPEQKSNNLSYIISAILVVVVVAAIIAMLIVKRRRRQEEEANLKVQEDLAFLDEEADMFSYENSPTKSNKRSFQEDGEEESSQSSGSRDNDDDDIMSEESPVYPGGVSSPTARSMMSGASTVKVSNARATSIPSKLSQIGSTSLFAFSEEDDEDLESNSGDSQHSPLSAAPSENSKDSSVFNKIMNSTPEQEAKLTPVSSPEKTDKDSDADASSTPTSKGGGGTPKSIASSIFSSLFVSNNDNASHFAGSTISTKTERVDNTTEGLIRRASIGERVQVDTTSTNNANRLRSVSCSPRVSHQKPPLSPSSIRSPAKSENGSVNGSVDSVFDFLSVSVASPKPSDPKTKGATSTTDESDLGALDLESLNAALDRVDEEVSEAAIVDSPAADSKAAVAPTVIVTKLSAGESPSKASVSSRNSSPSKSSPIKSSPNKQAFSPTKQASSPSKSSVVKIVGKAPAASPKSQMSVNAVMRPPVSPSKRTVEDDQESVDSDFLSDDMDSGAFPRRSRRHAKSTAQDGTTTYQTNAMAPNDWSMTDGLSDDDTLSEHGGAFPSPSHQNRKTEERSVDRSEKSDGNSGVASPTSKAGTESSQASASRQLINDLVWLSKKIAGVKQSAVVAAPGEAGPRQGGPQLETVDSLSYASQDNTTSPSNVAKLLSPPPSQSSDIANTPSGYSTNVVCQDCIAPPGKLNIVIHSTKDGPAVHDVKPGSTLEGQVYPGDLIIAVDDVDTRSFTAAQLMKMMAEKTQSERKITVLHFDDEDKES